MQVLRQIDPDVVIGGSPCQDLSRANKGRGAGLEGPKSRLFWEFVRVKESCERQRGADRPPLLFVLENVIPENDADRNRMSAALKVSPVRLKANLVSACNRDRYFWSNLRPTRLVPPSRVRRPTEPSPPNQTPTQPLIGVF